MAESDPTGKAPRLAVDRMDSEYPESASTNTMTPHLEVQQYANEEERQQAFKKFQAEQLAYRENRNVEEAKHEEDFENMHTLELEVDERIQDAIIHAEFTIKEMQTGVE